MRDQNRKNKCQQFKNSRNFGQVYEKMRVKHPTKNGLENQINYDEKIKQVEELQITE